MLLYDHVNSPDGLKDSEILQQCQEFLEPREVFIAVTTETQGDMDRRERSPTVHWRLAWLINRITQLNGEPEITTGYRVVEILLPIDNSGHYKSDMYHYRCSFRASDAGSTFNWQRFTVATLDLDTRLGLIGLAENTDPIRLGSGCDCMTCVKQLLRALPLQYKQQVENAIAQAEQLTNVTLNGPAALLGFRNA